MAKLVYNTASILLISSIFASLIILLNGILINKFIPNQGTNVAANFDYSVDRPKDLLSLSDNSISPESSSIFSLGTTYKFQIILNLPFQPNKEPIMLKTTILTTKGKVVKSNKKLIPYQTSPPQKPSFFQLIKDILTWIFNLDFTGFSNWLFGIFLAKISSSQKNINLSDTQTIILDMPDFKISNLQEIPDVLEIELSNKLLIHSCNIIFQPDNFFSNNFGRVFTLYNTFWPIFKSILIFISLSSLSSICILYRQS